MNREYHNRFAKMLFPWLDEKLIDRTNSEIDLPVKEFGRHHRKYRHDMRSAIILSMLEGKPDVLLIAKAHTLLDENKNLQRAVKLLGGI